MRFAREEIFRAVPRSCAGVRSRTQLLVKATEYSLTAASWAQPSGHTGFPLAGYTVCLQVGSNAYSCLGSLFMVGDDKSASLPVLSRRWREAIPNDRLAHLVKDLLRGIVRCLQIRLADHSVSYGYWAFFRVLWEHDGITQRELSEFAGVSEPTTYSALRSMESLGYITREKLPNNLRNICICLTPKGRALKSKLIPVAEELNAVAIRGIPARNIAIFRKTMIAMIENLEQHEIELDRPVPPLRKVG